MEFGARLVPLLTLFWIFLEKFLDYSFFISTSKFNAISYFSACFPKMWDPSTSCLIAKHQRAFQENGRLSGCHLCYSDCILQRHCFLVFPMPMSHENWLLVLELTHCNRPVLSITLITLLTFTVRDDRQFSSTEWRATNDAIPGSEQSSLS